ncbi:hypothetical protein DL95DRAFT_454586 [Leptodontidium sp. 2 PMI_412]|nr:hypothetical protein BKA61DRAFT_669650 [Leptodontidium sp. MPI-SDFR-AT-0119]KAH9222581.1 hypothetical protein DL95DRAFT_454586 [Leptodontidium sp. 2 PMI_412]
MPAAREHVDSSLHLRAHTAVLSDTSHDSSDLPSASPPPHHLDSHRTSSRPRNPSLSVRSRTETLSSITSTSSTSSSPVRRKPLPSTASPLATRFSSGEHLAATLQQPDQPYVRPYSVDSPTLHDFPPTSKLPFSPAVDTARSFSRFPNEPVALTSGTAPDTSLPNHQANSQQHLPSPKSPNLAVPSQKFPQASSSDSESKHARLASESALTSASESTSPWYSDSSSVSYSRSTTMSLFSTKPEPPHTINVNTRSFSNDSSTTIQKSQPKSPGGSKLGSLFGWGNTSPASSTTFSSEKGFSPIPSPHTFESNLTPTDVSKAPARNIPRAIDVPKANADTGGYFGSSYLQLPLATPTTPIQVEEMEKELKEISSELASSIRREMDLEDLVERLQSDALNPSSSPGKRTSDYFSDSGTSSVRYGEPDSKQDEMDRLLRKAEQEKAQMRLELTNKVQDERTRRKHLESQIRNLEEKASQVDLASINSMDANGRLRDLEATCEDLRRRLAEERQVKDNFEDLLTALKGELQSSHNERDNLRDEIVPSLRARVEGLEAQAAQHEKLTYEQTKTQQELQTLKNENLSLINAQRLQMEMQQQMKKFNTIAEEASPAPTSRSSGLFRSNSVAQGNGITRTRPPSLSRSASVKTAESRDSLAERVKDVELQRDALHSALKSLLERQEHQNRENQKKIRQLELERDRALSSSPRRVGYDKEVANLREEINVLRRRAEEAIEQKWQCEKGLSGLKMDLDRAEQEIGSLRSLLHEKDILIPTGPRERSASGTVSSETLERAYRELQQAYAESLDRVKNLETSTARDEETEQAMKELEQSLADAISERDFAQKEANSLQQQSDSLREGERVHMGNEVALAEELRGSAKRVEDLAVQVRQQLATNSTLRQRLSETIERGDRDQKANAEKIMLMQSKLKSLEDQLMIAQQNTEDKVSRHEDEIRDLKESHNIQLQRMKEGLRSPRSFGPKTPISPMFANSSRAPRIMSTTSGKAMTVSEDSKMEYLKQRVVELEAALAEADSEMEEVVGRMNIAQIEVMELQNEREEAVRETKRLQRQIESEKKRAFEDRFATLSS